MPAVSLEKLRPWQRVQRCFGRCGEWNLWCNLHIESFSRNRFSEFPSETVETSLKRLVMPMSLSIISGFPLDQKTRGQKCQVVHPSCPLRAEPHFDSKAGLSVTPFRWRKTQMSTKVLGWKQRGGEMLGPKWGGGTFQRDNHAKKSFLKPGTRRKWQEILKKIHPKHIYIVKTK